MEKRIENFIHTSENISKTYPDIGRFVDDEVQKLKQRWDDIRTRTQNTRRTIDLANEYFELADGVSVRYKYIIFFCRFVINGWLEDVYTRRF